VHEKFAPLTRARLLENVFVCGKVWMRRLAPSESLRVSGASRKTFRPRPLQRLFHHSAETYRLPHPLEPSWREMLLDNVALRSTKTMQTFLAMQGLVEVMAVRGKHSSPLEANGHHPHDPLEFR